MSAYCANFPSDATDEHLDRAFRGAGLLGTSVMTSSTEQPVIPRLEPRCRKHKVRMGLHNHWLGDSWFKGDKSINFEGPADCARGARGPLDYLGINLDIGHFSASGHDPVAYFREHATRIFCLHIKDRGQGREAHVPAVRRRERRPSPRCCACARGLKFRLRGEHRVRDGRAGPHRGRPGFVRVRQARPAGLGAVP